MVGHSDNERSLRHLAKRSQPEIAAIGARAALRLLPDMNRFCGNEQGANALLFPTLRATLISLAASMFPTRELRSAAELAASHTADVEAVSGMAEVNAADAFLATGSAALAASESDRSVAATYLGDFTDDLTLNDVVLLSSCSLEELVGMPLWPERRPPVAKLAWREMQFYLAHNSPFAFWLRWYQKILDGAPQNWAMLREIALIDPADWDAGKERVAERIAEIEARYASAPVDHEVVRAQAKRLSAQPNLVRVSAEGLAAQIEDWRTEVLRALGANALPDELHSMETMPAILRDMSLGAQLPDDDERVKALSAKIVQLIAEVEALRAALEAAKKGGNASIFSDAFKAKAGENCADLIFSRTTWGFLGAGVWTLCGGPVGETTIIELLKLVMK